MLKNPRITTELEQLLYELCISLNIVHLTTESLNKLIKMEGLNGDVNVLVRQLLIQHVFRGVAEERLKQVVVLLMRNEQNRELMARAILGYLNGEEFKGFIREQFRVLLMTNAFQQVLDGNAKSIITGNLKNP